MNGPFRRRRGSYLARTTDIAAENLGPGDRTLQRIHYLNISEFIRDEAWWFAACSLAASGSHFRDPHLMNNPTKMPTGNIRASLCEQQFVADCPTFEPAHAAVLSMTQKRFLRCLGDKAEILFSFRLTLR